MIILKKVVSSGDRKYRVQHQIKDGVYQIYNLPINGNKGNAIQTFSSPITLELIESIASHFSSPEKFYDKFKSVKGIPSELSDDFFSKYNSHTPMGAVRKMFNELNKQCK